MSLCFNRLSRFVVAFHLRNKCLNFMAAVTVHSNFRAQENKILSLLSLFHLLFCHEVMGPDAMILVFCMVSFETAFSLSSFTLIKRLFSSSSLSTIIVVSSACLRWLIFLPAILIPACDLSSLAFRMMYSAYDLYKQGNNIYSLDVLLPQFWTSQVFHVQF